MSDPGGSLGAPGVTVTAPNSSGGVVVASDVLLTQLDSLARLAESLRLSAGELAGVVESLGSRASLASDIPRSALEARRMSIAALQTVLAAANHAADLGAGVRLSLVRYAATEQFVMSIGHRVGEGIAEVLGAGFRIFGAPMLVTAVGGVLAGAALTGRKPAALALEAQSFLKVHGRILTNPYSVRIIRELASDADGFGEGFLLVPPPLADGLQSAGVTGVSSSATVVVGLGRSVGLFEPTGVTVRKTSSFEYGTPPTSLEDRSTAFPRPDTDPNGEQIRIDRYVEAGKPDRFDVFIPGTVTFNPKTATEPFDFQSDLAGVGNQPMASYQAVADALTQAGVTSSSPIVFNGYSQGGLVASQLAASGNYNVRGVVTFGSPTAQVRMPASIPVLTVRNSEDLVPATSGYDVNPNAVVVQRSAFEHSSVPPDFTVPAHELDQYQQTAAIVDGSTSSEVRGVLDPLNRFGDGATRVDSTLWLATRVPLGDASGAPAPTALAGVEAPSR
jgi:hypothetical protein